jgi:hypothetical protein
MQRIRPARILTDRLERLFSVFPLVVVSGALQDPKLLLNNQPSPVILDEIQYFPELMSCMKIT